MFFFHEIYLGTTDKISRYFAKLKKYFFSEILLSEILQLGDFLLLLVA